MKTQTAEEKIRNILFSVADLLLCVEFAENRINKIMHDHTTTQIEALRERLVNSFDEKYDFGKVLIDETINNFLKEINP
jgi:hypothetical protein